MIAMPLLTYEPLPPPTQPSGDDLHLRSYEAKLQLVKDYTKGVALGFSNGFFLFGGIMPRFLSIAE